METKAEMPAYPFAIATKRDGNGHVIAQDISHGLTKREHFASQAMIGMLSYVNKPIPPSEICEEAIRLADALISALNASKEESK